MALPAIIFNTGTGSDTAASGAGPASPLSGTGASTTAASNGVDLSADAPDLSGVATDGSAAIWVDASSGREFNKITAVNNGTKIVTCQSNYANTESSRGWGIGGKRATFTNSLAAFVDAFAGWHFVLEDNQSISAAITYSAVGNTTDGWIIMRSSVEGTTRTITQTTNAAHFSQSGLERFIDIKFDNSAGEPKTSAMVFSGNAAVDLIRCIIGDPTNKVYRGWTTASEGTHLLDCIVQNCLDQMSSGNAHLTLEGCVIRNNTSHGASHGTQSSRYKNCLIYGNGGNGITCSSGNLDVQNCVIWNNTSDGIEYTNVGRPIIINNHICKNGGYGLLGSAAGQALIETFINCNNFGNGSSANTSGARSNFVAGPNDVSVEPNFVDPDNGDFRVRNSATWGAGFPFSSRNIGYGTNPGTGTRPYIDIGIQHLDSLVLSSFRRVM